MWDVKPASACGRSRTASVDKLAGCVQGLHDEFGWPVVAVTRLFPKHALLEGPER
ncbi:hypothetical protein ACWEWP_33190 [Streptomyces olivaceus]|uniref:hypothetical protein n=1 Tax=Streptomyces olivaceus TaxID=47716 RepID=UPI0033B35A08